MLSEEERLFYFQNLIKRGYSVDIADGYNTVLGECYYGSKRQSELQKKFSDMLIAAGADTSLVEKFYE